MHHHRVTEYNPKEAKVAKRIMHFFEDRSLAQWDLLDSVFTEIKEDKAQK